MIVHEYRVTAKANDPKTFPNYGFTFKNEDRDAAQDEAWALLDLPGFRDSVHDVRIHHRTVAYGDWSEVPMVVAAT
jgi:UDP-N-acetylenolpyruvoylglucosamine reductase